MKSLALAIVFALSVLMSPSAASPCPPACPPEITCNGYCEFYTICQFLDWDGDGVITCDDLDAYEFDFFSENPCAHMCYNVLGPGQKVTPDDLSDYITHFFTDYQCEGQPNDCGYMLRQEPLPEPEHAAPQSCQSDPRAGGRRARSHRRPRACPAGHARVRRGTGVSHMGKGAQQG